MTKTFIQYWNKLNKALVKANCPVATLQEARFFFPSRTLDAEFVNGIRAKVKKDGGL